MWEIFFPNFESLLRIHNFKEKRNQKKITIRSEILKYDVISSGIPIYIYNSYKKEEPKKQLWSTSASSVFGERKITKSNIYNIFLHCESLNV